MIFAYITYAVGLSALAVLVTSFFLLSILKLYCRDYCQILMEEKVKAYAVLFENMMGKMTVSAIREGLAQSEPSTKVN